MGIEQTPLTLDHREQKQREWNAKLAELNAVTDPAGFPIDAGIKDTVAALQLMAFTTTESCEGHHSYSPWVRVDEVVPSDVYAGERELKEKLMKERGIQQDEIDRASPRYNHEKCVELEEAARVQLLHSDASFTRELVEWRERVAERAVRLQNLIDEFYKTGLSKESDDMRVCIEYPYRHSRYPSHIRDIPFLRVSSPRGDDDVSSLHEDERLAILARHQEEMRRFTEFLKSRLLA